jgi:RNA polymerase-binding transcription factor DksA
MPGVWGSGRADHYHYRGRLVSAASDSRKTHQWGMSKCTPKVQYICRRTSTCNATEVMSDRVLIVVIVGGWSAGLSAAKALRRAPVRLLLIDRTNRHLFQPLLYQVATSVLSPAQLASVERSADQLEEIQAVSRRAVAVSNLDRRFNQLRNARAALPRTQEGGFGICQECDNDIASKLLAVPWAQFCIRCQEAVGPSLGEIQVPSGDLLGRAA